MKKLFLFITALLFIGTASVFAQTANERAIAHYRDAETAYKNKEYSKTLTSLEETAKLLKKTNARIEALRIKAYTNMGNIAEARKSLTVFSGFTADYSLYQELNPYIERIERAEQKQFEAEQQALQQEAKKQEKQFRVQELLGQVMTKIGEDKLDEATNLLAQAKQLSAESEEKQRISQIESYLTETKEEKSRYQEAMAGNVGSMQIYLQKFANHGNAPKVAQLLQEKETAAYNAAVTSDKAADYRQYLSEFNRSDRRSDIQQRLAVAEEREAYQFFEVNKTTENAYAYLQKFPNGTHNPQVKAAYEELLYAEGLQYEQSGNFSKAKETYSSYKYVFPHGKNIAQVNSKLSAIDKKIARQTTLNQIDSKTYLMLAYATNGTYGIELGRLPGAGAGGYISGQFNAAGLKIGKTIGTITQAEVDASDDYKVGVLAGSIGVNYYITYPLWLYGGVGVSYQPYYYEQLDQSLTLEGRKDLVFFPELGVKSRLGGAVLKAGIQVIPGETSFQVGIGFLF